MGVPTRKHAPGADPETTFFSRGGGLFLVAVARFFGVFVDVVVVAYAGAVVTAVVAVYVCRRRICRLCRVRRSPSALRFVYRINYKQTYSFYSCKLFSLE